VAEGRAILRRLAAELPAGLTAHPPARRAAMPTMNMLADALAWWRRDPRSTAARRGVALALDAARSAWRKADRERRQAERPERVAR
jgi:hypothetical protein